MPLKQKLAAMGKKAPRKPSVWMTNIITSKFIPVLATWSICSRRMRETYELKVYECFVHKQKSNQQGSTEEHM
jgi:hypothetical protein